MSARPLLEAHGLLRGYPARGPSRRTRTSAVDGVDLELARGEALGLVGESGSGKSTLARLLLALEPADAGEVVFDGESLARVSGRRLRGLRRRFQPVFQDPFGSLDPLLRVATIIAEPLVAHRLGGAAERRRRVGELLAEVGLAAELAARRPATLSGGERQRVAIARALAPSPELLILDEPLSALDVTVQAQILALLARLRREHGLTLLLISHDLGVVRDDCGRVAVMYRGRLVELGPTRAVFADPAHPYTEALLAARPRPVPGWRPPPPPRPSPREWPAGACAFAPRCPLASDRCAHAPELVARGDGRAVACWER